MFPHARTRWALSTTCQRYKKKICATSKGVNERKSAAFLSASTFPPCQRSLAKQSSALHASQAWTDPVPEQFTLIRIVWMSSSATRYVHWWTEADLWRASFSPLVFLLLCKLYTMSFGTQK
ncbi:hypothetical protein CEXT_713951 [Caerostris extrusa]|uniref:Uncharacterized protein n=1 Tax=Caerostris extrusa TaxID=172846 RepID=A0AAV4N3B8_CAEEX|nr:hypothetical protein CEXT_713951 [Caerostris extrusa]